LLGDGISVAGYGDDALSIGFEDCLENRSPNVEKIKKNNIEVDIILCIPDTSVEKKLHVIQILRVVLATLDTTEGRTIENSILATGGRLRRRHVFFSQQ
jgi:hypothetical protein